MSRLVSITIALSAIALPAFAAEPVNVHNFARAETDTAMRMFTDRQGIGELGHFRTPAPVEDQPIIRMNRDTLYSTAVLDLTEPATVTLPEIGGRYQSMQVINQDHYTYAVSAPGAYELTQDKVGSRYVYLIFRTFLDANDQADIKAANGAQDGIAIEGGVKGPLEVPDWDQDQLLTARQALNTLATLGSDTSRAFGLKEEVDPIDHLVATAAGWGGLPKKNAYYQIPLVEKNDGTPHALTVKDAPVDGFWSITVYNAEGYIEPNDRGVYSFNNITARPNEDGSYTIHFGGCDDGRINCIPAPVGWNYAVRMYQPREEILNGSWSFPAAQPVE